MPDPNGPPPDANLIDDQTYGDFYDDMGEDSYTEELIPEMSSTEHVFDDEYYLWNEAENESYSSGNYPSEMYYDLFVQNDYYYYDTFYNYDDQMLYQHLFPWRASTSIEESNTITNFINPNSKSKVHSQDVFAQSKKLNVFHK